MFYECFGVDQMFCECFGQDQMTCWEFEGSYEKIPKDPTSQS